MHHEQQLTRYKTLLSYIDAHFKEDINIEKVESISHYSYRNINRIFEALHHETIGKYIKRLRLEKAAQYLKYSELGISDIGFEVGFEDRAAFSKAFKKKYGYSPSAFRESSDSNFDTEIQLMYKNEGKNREKLQFEIIYLPAFDYLFLEHRGDYNDFLAMENTGDQVYDYALQKGLLTPRSKFMTEVVDDSTISDSIHLRYNMGFILEQSLPFAPEGLYRVKHHSPQKYARFMHQGTYQSCSNYYEEIYAYWMMDVNLELKDLPSLEFYPDADINASNPEILTEIYIPVV
ncbi:MAG: AraC family transcriptional regulator [Bacteroidota bacterium]